MDRRDFLKTCAAAGAALNLGVGSRVLAQLRGDKAEPALPPDGTTYPLFMEPALVYDADKRPVNEEQLFRHVKRKLREARQRLEGAMLEHGVHMNGYDVRVDGPFPTPEVAPYAGGLVEGDVYFVVARPRHAR